MAEVYICVCGGQQFTIQGSTITCPSCGRIHYLMWLDDEMEPPEDFNERIRKEGGK